MKRCTRGFTLIELLVVIAIIAILVAMLLPAVQQVREAARKSQCQDHLHNLVIALHDYEINASIYPPGGFREGVNQGNALSWHAMILPYIEQKPLYDQLNFNFTSYNQNANKQYALEVIDLFLCPSGNQTHTGNTGEHWTASGNNQRTTTTHYYGVMGPKSPGGTGMPLTPKIGGGTYPRATSTSGHGYYAVTGVLRKQVSHKERDVTDGTSNTLVVGEISWNDANTYRVWLRGCEGSASGGVKNIENPINAVPYNGSNNFNDVSFGSEHAGGAQFCALDGKVTFLSENIDMMVYRALGSREEGEVAKLP
jgi:prepilin-type N-terminal cleavage/methylation domain-containing protein